MPEEREEIIGSTQLLAGLRFDVNLVRNLFRGGFMRESVVFQEILQEGRQEGRQEGKQQLWRRSYSNVCWILNDQTI